MEKYRIVLYGCGGFFSRIYRDISEYHEIVGITDTVKDNINEKYRGLYISPDDLNSLDYDRVFISSERYSGDIYRKLVYECSVDKRKIVSYPYIEGYMTVGMLEKTGIIVPERYRDRVFVIGDSHSQFFGRGSAFFPLHLVPGVSVATDKDNRFTVFHLGPCLANSMCGYDHSVPGHERVNALCDLGLIPEGAKVICCFGEIDIRVHVIMQSKEQKCSVERIIDQIIDRYMTFLSELNEHCQVYAWGPVAGCKDGCKRDVRYPYYGSELERNAATAYFNKALKDICKQEGIGFISIFDELVEGGKTVKDYYKDNIHLGENAWKLAEPVLIEEFDLKNTVIRKGEEYV